MYKPLRGDFQKLVRPTQSGPSSAAVVCMVASHAIASDCSCSANGRFTTPACEWRGICGPCHGIIAMCRQQNVQQKYDTKVPCPVLSFCSM